MTPPVLRFDGFEFDASTGELRKGGRVERIQPQPAALLAMLVSRPGTLVTRDEVRRHIWGEHTHVNLSENLAYCIREIRQALGDDARAPRYVETIPRRGYRFLTAASAPAPRPTRSIVLPRIAATIAIAVFLAAAWAVERRPNRHHEMAVGALRTVHALLF